MDNPEFHINPDDLDFTQPDVIKKALERAAAAKKATDELGARRFINSLIQAMLTVAPKAMASVPIDGYNDLTSPNKDLVIKTLDTEALDYEVGREAFFIRRPA